jgi:hypothetical protein
VFAASFMSITSMMYDYAGGFGRSVLVFLTWALPQLPLFDLSGKAVHADIWDPIRFKTMGILFLYALVFSSVYYFLALIWFRRRPL